MAHDVQIAVDCARPHELADWWAEALGWEVEPQDEAFIRRMVAEGHAAEEHTVVHRGALRWRSATALRSPDAGRPRMLFQAVPEPKPGKNRLHLDLNPDDQEAEVRRLLGLGATRKDIGQGDAGWAVLADPEGNEFCVLTPRAP